MISLLFKMLQVWCGLEILFAVPKATTSCKLFSTMDNRPSWNFRRYFMMYCATSARYSTLSKSCLHIVRYPPPHWWKWEQGKDYFRGLNPSFAKFSTTESGFVTFNTHIKLKVGWLFFSRFVNGEWSQRCASDENIVSTISGSSSPQFDMCMHGVYVRFDGHNFSSCYL